MIHVEEPKYVGMRLCMMFLSMRDKNSLIYMYCHVNRDNLVSGVKISNEINEDNLHWYLIDRRC